MNENPKKILVVIDEVVTSQAIVSILQSTGYEVKGINSNSQILEITQQFQPDTILISVTFDETDGYFLCRMIKEKNHEKSINVILLQQELDKNYVVDPLCGPDEFLIIPFSLDSLLKKINNNLATHPAGYSLSKGFHN